VVYLGSLHRVVLGEIHLEGEELIGVQCPCGPVHLDHPSATFKSRAAVKEGYPEGGDQESLSLKEQAVYLKQPEVVCT